MTGKVFIGAHIDQALFDKLDEAAKSIGVSKAALLRHLLRQCLAVPVVLSIQTAPPPSD
jgi:hypothetical protein